MNSIILSSPEETKIVYYQGNKILAVEEGVEGNFPQGQVVALLNTPKEKRVRIFTFKKEDIDKSAIFGRVAEYVGTTNFIFDVFEWRSYYIVSVIGKRTFDLIRKIFTPSKMVPFDFVVLWNIQKQLKRPLVALRNELFYFFSNSDVIVSVIKKDIEQYITPDTVVIDADSSKEFPNLQIVPVKHKWSIDKKAVIPESDMDVRNIEFVVRSKIPIDIMSDVVIVASKKEVNSLPELKYTLSLLVVFFVFLLIHIFSPFISSFVQPSVPIVNIASPSSIDLTQVGTPSFSFNEFIYKKGYPYVLYEAYDSNDHKVATFINKDDVISWQKQHSEFTVYAVTYDKNGIIDKVKLSEVEGTP